MGGREKRARLRRYFLPISTYHHSHFLCNIVPGDASLGKVRLSEMLHSHHSYRITDLYKLGRVLFCSVSGAVLLVIGLYGILWVKSREGKMAATNVEAQNDEGKMEGSVQKRFSQKILQVEVGF